LCNQTVSYSNSNRKKGTKETRAPSCAHQAPFQTKQRTAIGDQAVLQQVLGCHWPEVCTIRVKVFSNHVAQCDYNDGSGCGHLWKSVEHRRPSWQGIT
jgi:hypothetical protein